jgi:hypothetical protein
MSSRWCARFGFENPTYPDGQAAAMYGQFPPLVNASHPAGQWQSYDILFTAPRFGPGECARVTGRRDRPAQRRPGAPCARLLGRDCPRADQSVLTGHGSRTPSPAGSRDPGALSQCLAARTGRSAVSRIRFWPFGDRSLVMRRGWTGVAGSRRAIGLALAATVLLSFGARAFTQTLTPRPSLRVLFIGNSYTYFNNLGDIVSGIAAADAEGPTSSSSGHSWRSDARMASQEWHRAPTTANRHLELRGAPGAESAGWPYGGR